MRKCLIEVFAQNSCYNVIFQGAIEARRGDSQKEDKRKRILDYNLTQLEKENRPTEMQQVFQGAEQEKIKAIKKGEKTLTKNDDLLKPRTGWKPWEKVTDLTLVDGKPKLVKKEKKSKDKKEMI